MHSMQAGLCNGMNFSFTIFHMHIVFEFIVPCSNAEISTHFIFPFWKKFDPSDLVSPLLAENKLMHEPGKNAICTDKIW